MATFVSTDPASLGGTAGSAGFLQKAYDKAIGFQLRAEPLLRSVVDVTPNNLTSPGQIVVLQKMVDLTADTTPLDELVDPDGAAMVPPTTVTITLREYGKSVTKTRNLKNFSYTDVDPAIANVVAQHQIDTLEAVVMNVLKSGTNVIYSGSTATSTATVTAAATLSTANIARAVSKLRANKAKGKRGSDFWVGIHPEASYDLMLEAGSAGWLVPNAYGSDQSKIWAGEVGRYKGGFFVESPRLYSANDGALSAKVYRTIVAGAEAIAEAVGEEPHTEIGNMTDSLNRFRKIGWYGVLGHAVYRNEALYRIESGSSIAV